MRLGRFSWCAVVLLVACASRKKRDAPRVPPSDAARAAAPEQPPAVATVGAVVGRFRTRDHEIVWLATDAGPRFTVAALDGAVLATNLTDAEVAERFPELAEFARGALAGLDASVHEDVQLDASDGD